MKGKHWGSLTKQPGTEYQQVSSGEAHGGNTASKFVPGDRKSGFATNTSGESHSSVKSKAGFLGDTKGNADSSPNKTSGAPEGQYKGT